MENTKITNNTQSTSTGNGSASVPMASTGSKGRSGGSKFKNLLAKLSGGHHGSKSSKVGDEIVYLIFTVSTNS